MRKLFIGLGLLLSLLTFSPLTMAASKIYQFYVHDSFEPFTYVKNGETLGTATEMVKQVCRTMGIACTITGTEWGQAMSLAKGGAMTGLFVAGKNAEREEWSYFSAPLLRTAYGVFVQKGDALRITPKTVTEDLSGYTVSTLENSNMLKSLKKIAADNPKIQIETAPNLKFSFVELDEGQLGDVGHAAIFCNKDVGEALIKKLGLKNVVYAGEQRSLLYYVMFPKKSNSPEFVKQFNDALVKLQTAGAIPKVD